FRGPRAFGDIEQQRAGGIREVDSAIAGKTETHVIFWKHDVTNARPELRLILANPENFGERKIRERRIAGQLNEALRAELLRKIAGLFFGALIAPDERGANHFAAGVQQNGAMHLAGKPD